MQDTSLALSAHSYDPFVHDHACMAKCVDHVWYFDNGATKHITYHHRDLFTFIKAVPYGNIITCANIYPIQLKELVPLYSLLKMAASSHFWMLCIYLEEKKKLLSFFALAQLVLVVKFVDDRCMVHDKSSSDTIVASSTLFHGLYKINACKSFDQEREFLSKEFHSFFATCGIKDQSTMPYTQLRGKTCHL